MDSNANPDTSVTPLSGGISGSWLRQNLINLVIGIAALVAVFIFLNPLDVFLAGAGLTLIIFLHELGHFAAAKICKVRVEAFSIGFGPPIPFCSYKYGETTYKLCMVPLGGYVKMLGEGDGANDEDAEDDPRSFKRQSVGERMFIISAGVIMNLILGCTLFVIVYMHGLEEIPAVVASMEPGGAAWRQGIHSGTEIRSIGGIQSPWFDDIRPSVWATNKGEQLPLTVSYKGNVETFLVEPLQEEGAPYPVLGIRPPEKLTLIYHKKSDELPYRVGSAAAAAKASDGSAGFLPGDRIVAMSDPAEPDRKPTALTPKADGPPGDIFVYYQRLAKLAAEPIMFHVERKDRPESDAPIVINVLPAYRRETGARMRMGEVIATRHNSPADNPVQPGDIITDVEIADATGITLYTNTPPEPGPTRKKIVPLDPIRLPLELNRWADKKSGTKRVKLTVLRDVDHTRKPVQLEVAWDDVGRFDIVPPGTANAPMPINGLGLAYRVQAVVDAVSGLAKDVGLLANDTITAVRFKVLDHKGKEITTPWEEIKPHHWAYVDFVLQRQAPFEVEVRVARNGAAPEMKLATVEDNTLAVEERGIDLTAELRIMRANGVGEALNMGARRTVRSIKSIYMNLYAMIFGRVSFKTMSGPITLARASYLIAGEDVYRLMLLLALISINLAVVNFLPIPVLDGGHMMFLTYEWLRGKPAPESVQTILTFAGLGIVLLMMLFVVGLDIWRLASMWLNL